MIKNEHLDEITIDSVEWYIYICYSNPHKYFLQYTISKDRFDLLLGNEDIFKKYKLGHLKLNTNLHAIVYENNIIIGTRL